jgi:hypothetical protein
MAEKNRVLEWCGMTADKMKRGLNTIPMAKAGKQAGRWLWGDRRK